jgi:transposase
MDPRDLIPGSTARDRFQEWVEAKVFIKLWQAEPLPADFGSPGKKAANDIALVHFACALITFRAAGLFG